MSPGNAGLRALIFLVGLFSSSFFHEPLAHASDYATHVLGDGGGPYYRLDESGGASVHDASAAGINAIYTDLSRISFRQPGLLPLDQDAAISVDGAGFVLPPTSSIVQETMEGWFRPTAAVDADALIVRVDAGGGWQRMLWITAGWPGKNRFAYSFFVNGVQYNVVGTTTAVPNSSYYVAVTLETSGGHSTAHLYVDGVEEAWLDVEGTPVDAAHWQVGLEGGGALRDFVGVMDEVAFYDSVLSAAQIRQHYGAGGALPTPPPPSSTPNPTALPRPTPRAPTAYEATALRDGAAPFYAVDEPSGSLAFDLAPSALAATYVDPSHVSYLQPSLVPNATDPAVLLLGTGIALPPTQSPAAETVEGWFRPTENVDADAMIVRVDTDGSWQRMLWITAGWPERNRFAYSFFVDGIQYNVVGTTTVVPNRTYHVAATLDTAGHQSAVRLYVDGREEARLDIPGTPVDARQWQIGLEGGGALHDFVGVIDEVAFYDRALPPNQVANHYSVGGGLPMATPTPSSTPGPTGPPTISTPSAYQLTVTADGAAPFYALDEASGAFAYDASPARITATYVDPQLVSYSEPSLVPSESNAAVYLWGTGIEVRATASPTSEAIEGWFRPADNVDADALIVRVDQNGVWQRMLWITGGWPARNRFAYSFTVNGTQYDVVGTTTVVPDRTYFVAVTQEISPTRTLVQLYLDGLKEAELDAQDVPPPGDHWQIGLEGGGGLKNYIGVLDDVAFYGTALTATQVSQHFAVGQLGVLPTATPTRPCCAGDCDANGTVTIDELIALVNITLGSRPASDCANPQALDCDTCHPSDGYCVVPFVNNALFGCPGR